MQLRIPGPTPIPPEILNVLSRQMINHRGPQFAELIQGMTAILKELFQTKGDVFILTGSGTGGMEAAIVNMLSPGDKVLVVSNGFFGERFADIAEGFGAQVDRLRFEWGSPVDPEAVRQALARDPGVRAVLVTHNETSTGVTNDLGSIGAVVKEFEKLLLVDAISSLGAIDAMWWLLLPRRAGWCPRGWLWSASARRRGRHRLRPGCQNTIGISLRQRNSWKKKDRRPGPHAFLSSLPLLLPWSCFSERDCPTS